MAYRTSALRIDRDNALRGRILRCAQARVTEAGFAALTMQALAEDVGIATGSLYRHFRNKGELAAEVFALASQREVDAMALALHAPLSAPKRLAAGLTQFATRAWHSRRLAYALIAEPVDPEVDEQRLLFRQAYAELLVEVLEQGIASGHFRPQHTQLSAACLVGAIAESLVGPLSPSACAARARGQDALALGDITADLIAFCLSAVGAKELSA
ncbi:TetR/AcrR family transcriptional regulator [Pseudomonas sp. EL_65y_Pfl2_R95]|uniref:TetR/AcrR family transcriptional regulator n=1 Tax=Pseudomonas sp. EL_65y_Pfl2_R95 TaxID=3088698 RepID=UPI0030DB6FA0